MLKWIITIYLVIISSIFVFAEDIATPIKQDNPNKLKMVVTGSSSTTYKELQMTEEGYAKVYNMSGSSGGTTTSNIFGYDNNSWYPVQIATTTIGIENQEKVNGIVTHSALYGWHGDYWTKLSMKSTTGIGNWLSVGLNDNPANNGVGNYVYSLGWVKLKGDDSGYAYTKDTIISPAPVINMLPAHPYLGCKIVTFYDTVATTTATVISGIVGKKIYILGIDYYNKAATSGDVTFFDGSNVIYRAVITGSIGAGFLPLTYLELSSDNSFKVTTPAGCSINIYYKQL